MAPFLIKQIWIMSPAFRGLASLLNNSLPTACAVGY